MAADPDNVKVAVTGIVSVAPTGTTGPADSTTALDVAFTDVGEIGEDGVVESWSDDTTDIKNNAGTTIRRIIIGTTATLQFTMLESTSTTQELFYKGSTVSGTAGAFAIDIAAPQSDRRSFVLDTLDGDVHERVYIPDGEVTDRGDVTYVSSTVRSYQVTVSCYPDTSGNLMYKYSDNAAWA